MPRLGIVVGGSLLRRPWFHDLVCCPGDDFVHGPGATVLRRELARLERTFNENVVALLVRGGDLGEVAVENQAVPVRVFLSRWAAGTGAFRPRLAPSRALPIPRRRFAQCSDDSATPVPSLHV